jgi:hypothetical protein
MFRQILRNTGTNTTILPFVSVSSEFVLHSDLFRFLHIQHRKRIVLNQLKTTIKERDEKMIRQILDDIINQILNPPTQVPTRDLGIPYIVFETIGNYIWDHVKR